METTEALEMAADNLCFPAWLRTACKEGAAEIDKMRAVRVECAAQITDLDKVKQLPLSDEAAHAIYEAWYDDNESGVDLVRRVEAAYGIGDV